MSADEALSTPEGQVDDSPSLPLNAVVGAVVTLVSSPLLPVAAVVGGGVAGYLQGGTFRQGLLVGTLSGVLAGLPVFLLVWSGVAYLLLGGVHLVGFTSVLGLVVLGLLVGYFAGTGAVGGALGAALRRRG